MINLELIEFADLTKPAEIVTEILTQNPGITIPIPLDEIAHASGIHEIHYKPLDGLEGALVANPEKSEGVILVNEKARHHRQRFTLGHELGHFLIPRHGHKMECGINELSISEKKSMNSIQRIELEANKFSAELLMPAILFTQFKGYRNEPSINCLIEQSNFFDVSFEACAHRYVALHDYPVAIVFSHNGKVRYSTSNKEFPFWVIPSKGDNLPVQSYTHSLNFSKANSISTGISDSSNWIESNRDYETPEEVIEEVYIMESGYTVTMLSFDDELNEIT